MLNAIDTKLFYLINKNCINQVFDFAMPLITMLGSGEAILILSAVLFFLRKRDMRLAGILLFAGFAISGFAVHFLKDWVSRPRPFMVLPDVRLLVGGQMGFSFPSGHAVNSFLAAAILSKFFKRHILFFAIASLVGFSRVYIGVHFVSDVIAGALIGALIGYVLATSLKKENL